MPIGQLSAHIGPIKVVTDVKHRLRTLVIALMAPSFVFAGGKLPKCDASHVGQFRPEGAKTDMTHLEELARSEDLQMCVRTPERRYVWQHLTVSVEQLKTKGPDKQLPSGEGVQTN
jgi:hypothetical protein